ncbi:MAG: thioredoxin family protein [Planctomycetes bacterium]|nr:thioredoxin family protein [Planctomycetota bacterium]
MKLLKPVAIVLTFAVTLIVLQKLSGAGTAPVPAVFDQGYTFEQAVAKGRSEKKPVLAFATADWCGPCQAMKREVLSEQSIEGQIRRDFVPAYVNIDKEPAAAQALKVFSIPATIVLWDGKVVARMEGMMPHDSYEQWLAAARDQARSPQPFVERASDEFLRNLKEKVEKAALPSGETPAPRPPN